LNTKLREGSERSTGTPN